VSNRHQLHAVLRPFGRVNGSKDSKLQASRTHTRTNHGLASFALLAAAATTITTKRKERMEGKFSFLKSREHSPADAVLAEEFIEFKAIMYSL
jgi:hypothetical protein